MEIVPKFNIPLKTHKNYCEPNASRGFPFRANFSTSAQVWPCVCHEIPGTRDKNGSRFEFNFVFNEGRCLNKGTVSENELLRKDGTSSFLAYCEVGKRVLKVGVHLKAVSTPLKIGQIEISCLHFKQHKNPPSITQINDLGCFMNFWVIFRYIWKEIIFLEGLVKLKEIRNVEDLVKF